MTSVSIKFLPCFPRSFEYQDPDNNLQKKIGKIFTWSKEAAKAKRKFFFLKVDVDFVVSVNLVPSRDIFKKDLESEKYPPSKNGEDSEILVKNYILEVMPGILKYKIQI